MYFSDLTPLCLKQGGEGMCLPRSGTDVKQSGLRPNWILNSLCPWPAPLFNSRFIHSEYLDRITVRASEFLLCPSVKKCHFFFHQSSSPSTVKRQGLQASKLLFTNHPGHHQPGLQACCHFFHFNIFSKSFCEDPSLLPLPFGPPLESWLWVIRHSSSWKPPWCSSLAALALSHPILERGYCSSRSNVMVFMIGKWLE